MLSEWMPSNILKWNGRIATTLLANSNLNLKLAHSGLTTWFTNLEWDPVPKPISNYNTLPWSWIMEQLVPNCKPKPWNHLWLQNGRKWKSGLSLSFLVSNIELSLPDESYSRRYQFWASRKLFGHDAKFKARDSCNTWSARSGKCADWPCRPGVWRNKINMIHV